MSDIDAKIEADAADWAVKAQSGVISEADIVALTDWLDASPRHAAAYGEALSLWTSLDAPVPEEKVTPSAWRSIAQRPKRRFGLRAVAGSGLAAVVAVAIMAASGMFAPVQTYDTQKGERETVTLSDGTQLMLNTDTRLSVKITASARTVTLDKGEVAITVAHNDGQPFRVLSGDLTLTDIGTTFNVARLNGEVRVAVREGEVEMAARSAKTRLLPGDLGTYREASGARTMTRADPAEAFAWQSSRAIYRNQPLSVVAADLNRYFDKPIIVEGDAAQLRLNAILTLDSQTAVAGRITEFLPVDARTTPEAIYIRSRASGR
ncbi:FecR domain-containing protein [Asticcacaulis sp. AND118]|uniref:FecR family protein n=1 Tax=Asticcacaulis sp. AND118 TaxID=2840468 RepID=UPI001CFF7FF7|nr:FecR domain-containing protein [Asticcacaulis sp. AND118]UDF04544.1 FecR domain-containing protein [Asticcacaulis sp. AND118]